ncbi:MAG: ERF family protein [Phycisphaerales bacterium]|jgi:hypothetical protein
MSRPNGVKAVALVPTDGLPLAESAQPEPASMFERLLKDPAMDPEKMERFMAMQERVTAKTAEAEFNAAMSQAQADIHPIAADAENPQTRSRYASYWALDKALRPIYTQHGFGLSFDTADAPASDWVRVICYVTHAGGHSRTYHADIPADGKGARGGDVMTKTHAVGSALSYGMRYLLKMIFNVAVGEDDDDGNGAAGKKPAAPPEGYLPFVMTLDEAAEQGLDALKAAWAKGTKALRDYHVAADPAAWEATKKQAGKVRS